MSKAENQLQSSIPAGDRDALKHLKEAIASGKHWYIAMLEAMGLWTSVEENYKGHNYRYLIDGEAFDWLSLAERLCLEVDGLIPEEEKAVFLFTGKPPVELGEGELQRIFGVTKYRAYLNYLYGVVVEEALVLAVEEEVRKEQCVSGFRREECVQDEAYRRIYESDMRTLLQSFRAIKGHPHRKSMSLTEQKEFTYWRFKYRLKHCDKARVASDTKKALDYLQRHKAADDLTAQHSPEESFQIVDLSPESYSS